MQYEAILLTLAEVAIAFACAFPIFVLADSAWLLRTTIALVSRAYAGRLAEHVVIHVNLRDLLPGEARISHTVPMAMRRRGVESRLVIEHGRGGSEASGLDLVLIKAIARGRQWFEDLVSGRAGSLVEIAKAEGVTESYVGRLVPLAFLAPDIVESVLAGTQPVHVTTEMLTKRVDLPIDWKEQRSLLGFERAPAS